MCYPSPGPRCSSSAYKKFRSAYNEWKQGERAGEVDHDAYARLRAARDEFDQTPLGQTMLRKQIATSGDPSGGLTQRLTNGIQMRAHRLALLHTPDMGDKQNEGESPTVFNEIRIRDAKATLDQRTEDMVLCKIRLDGASDSERPAAQAAYDEAEQMVLLSETEIDDLESQIDANTYHAPPPTPLKTGLFGRRRVEH